MTPGEQEKSLLGCITTSFYAVVDLERLMNKQVFHILFSKPSAKVEYGATRG